MNTTEELLKQAYDALKLHFKPQATKPAQKRWKPKLGHEYGYIDDRGKWVLRNWAGDYCDDYRHETGNCYQPHEQELAIWEQVTRRKYEQALWDAADWVSGDYYIGAYGQVGFWNKITTVRMAETKNQSSTAFLAHSLNLPRFATEQSAIDAHTKILGNDAERYFKGRG